MRLLIVGALLIVVAGIFAQDSQNPRPNTYTTQALGRNAAPRLISPEVHADRTIAFRIRAPRAQEVLLTFGSGGKPQPMKKDDEGLWSTTVGPVEPEIYYYTFTVDGLRVLDMANPALKNGRALDASIVEVPGNPPRFDELQSVPHGTIQIRTYTSTPLKRVRKLYVYLPPAYDSEPKRRFPVLYHRHGSGDNE